MKKILIAIVIVILVIGIGILAALKLQSKTLQPAKKTSIEENKIIE